MLFREWENINVEEADDLNKHTNSKVKGFRSSSYDVDNFWMFVDYTLLCKDLINICIKSCIRTWITLIVVFIYYYL